jgi:hypothetical protein
MHTIKKNTEALLDTRKETGLNANVERTKFMFLPCEQTAGQNPNTNISNKSYGRVAKFKYFGKTLKKSKSNS